MDEIIQQYFYTPESNYINSLLYITWAGHRVCGPRHNIGPRVLDTYKLVFIVRGSGYLEQGRDEVCRLGENDAFVLFPMEHHHYYADPDDPWELMWVAFNGSTCHDLLASIGLTRKKYVFPNTFTGPVKKTMTRLISALGDQEDDKRLCAVGQLYILFGRISMLTALSAKSWCSPDTNTNISKLLRFIDQNYYLEIDVNVLCSQINYSRSYLSRIFKAEVGMTIPEYLCKVRMENARFLLRDSSLSVKEVASSVGINDPFYFSKLFKKEIGLSPKEFRDSQTDSL